MFIFYICILCYIWYQFGKQALVETFQFFERRWRLITFQRKNVFAVVFIFLLVKMCFQTHSFDKILFNKKILFNNKPQTKSCNCIKKPDCPLNNQCQITSIIYQAKVTATISNYNPKIYYKKSEETFKLRHLKHKKFFCHEQYQKDMDLRT